MLSLFLCVLFLLAALASCNPRSQSTDEGTSGGDGCLDGECDVPTVDEDGNQVYSIVSPVGYNAVEMITQAPRLDTLAGKTIALVGGSFMASVTHAEIEKCIREQYPTAKIYSFGEVGSGGPYSVFGQSQQTKNFQNRLKELGVDAVISGNCGCGLCTTKESGSSIAAEYIGIPTVTVGAPTFIAQIHSTGVNRGVPVLRCAEYPGAFSSHSTTELIENARRVVFPAIVDALTREITEEEIALYANEGKRPYDEIIYYGSYEEIQEFCRVNDWTDGLPVVPPTDEKIKEYLRFTPYEADTVLGTYALAYRECTVYTVAANAVMAGVPKEFMPLCIAFVQCLENGEWRRPLASTHGWSPYAWINGPVARQLGIDHGQGMISEENNKALGRFLDLAMLNIGGYYVKENRMGTFGYLSPWTFSEDEEACMAIGWEPYHVTKGYSLNSSTLTAASALQWGNNVTPATDDAEQIMTLMAWDITEKQQNGLGNTNPQVYRTVFITEYVAKDLAKLYSSKGALEDALIETARRPLWMRAYAHYWANTGSQQFDKRTLEEHYQMLLSDSAELAEMTDTPDWLKGLIEDDKIMTIATMLKGQTPLLITGDTDRNKFQVMPGGGYVTIEIKLPDNWDALLAPLGYEPLSSFYLEDGGEQQKPDQGGNVGDSPIVETTASLPDGTYRMVPSLAQLTAGGRAYLDSDGTIHYREEGSTVTKTVPISSLKDHALATILRSLCNSCSFTLSAGKVTSIILRPSTLAQKPTSDLSVLTASVLHGVDITVAVNTKQSMSAGNITPSGATLVLSRTLTSFQIDMDGQMELHESSTAGFLTLNGRTVTVNEAAELGSNAKVMVKLSGGKYRMLTFVLKSDNTLSVTYTTSDA